MEHELKDCPFCGNQIKNYPFVMSKRQILPDSYVIQCVRCGATGGTGWNIEEAIKKWNIKEELDLSFLD